MGWEVGNEKARREAGLFGFCAKRVSLDAQSLVAHDVFFAGGGGWLWSWGYGV
jgi:hypothetical protein